MIILYPASPSRIIALLKTLRHIIENLKKKRERKERSCMYLFIKKLNYGYQVSSIFIGSPDTGYQLIYLHYQIWSMNASANKNFPSTPTAVKNCLAAELTSRYSGSGLKYKWNSSLYCSECFRMTKGFLYKRLPF